MSLYKLNQTEPNLYEYVSFNIRTYYCVHELIYYSNWNQIKFIVCLRLRFRRKKIRF
jgi:hypothetical protein